MSTALAIPDPQTAIVPRYGWTRDQVDLIKNTIAKGTTDDELALFCQTAKRMGLDPFAKQIYAQKRRDKRLEQDVLVILTGIDGYRLIGHRTGEMAGMEGPFWCGPDGEWKEVWLEKGYPAAAKVEIYRKGIELPFIGVATWRSFVQAFRDGNPMGQWASMPDIMIAKCAEAQAWRRAFPAELSGVHVPEEMDQMDREPEGFERVPTVPNLPPAPAKTPKASPAQKAAARDAAEIAARQADMDARHSPQNERPAPAPEKPRDGEVQTWERTPGPAPAARTQYEESMARVEAASRAAAEPEIIEAEAFETPAADPLDAKLAEFRAELLAAKDGAQMTTVREKWSPRCAAGAELEKLKSTIGAEWTAKAKELKAAAAAAAKGGQ